MLGINVYGWGVDKKREEEPYPVSKCKNRVATELIQVLI